MKVKLSVLFLLPKKQFRLAIASGITILGVSLFVPRQSLQAQTPPQPTPPQLIPPQPTPSLTPPQQPTSLPEKKGLACGFVTIAGFANLSIDEAKQKMGVQDNTLSVADFSRLMQRMGISGNPVIEPSRQKAYEYMTQQHGEYALGWESKTSGEGHVVTVTSNSDGLSFRDCGSSMTYPPTQDDYQFYLWTVKH